MHQGQATRLDEQAANFIRIAASHIVGVDFGVVADDGGGDAVLLQCRLQSVVTDSQAGNLRYPLCSSDDPEDAVRVSYGQIAGPQFRQLGPPARDRRVTTRSPSSHSARDRQARRADRCWRLSFHRYPRSSGSRPGSQCQSGLPCPGDGPAAYRPCEPLPLSGRTSRKGAHCARRDAHCSGARVPAPNVRRQQS